MSRERIMKKMKILVFVFLLQLSLVTEAALVNISTGWVQQTAAGQLFTFDFSGLPLSDGADGELILRARGDYSTTVTGFDESISLAIDGFDLGNHRMDDSNSTILNSFGNNDNEWEKTIAVGAFFLDTLWLPDGTINLVVDLGNDVSLDFTNSALAYIDVTLRYTVPAPPVIFLFVIAFLLLLGVRQMNAKKI